MKVLLTGSTGYIGRRLLPVLVNSGHRVVCAVRDRRRFDYEDFDEEFLSHVEVLEADFCDLSSLSELPDDLDAAYFLIHSLNANYNDFKNREMQIAANFSKYIQGTMCRQVVYLGGIANAEKLSQHLDSRKCVEEVLKSSGVPVTVLRAGIVIGSGSASFEIIRDIVEKLPVMIAPRWVKTRCQPIAVRNVLDYLSGVLGLEKTFGKTYDIAGNDILTYREMILKFARTRGLRRYILVVPVLTPRLSSLWLHLVTSTSYYLARNLIDSMRNEVVAAPSDIDELVPIQKKLSYEASIKQAFVRINQKQVVSSWKDSFSSRRFNKRFIQQLEAPDYGCLKDRQIIKFTRDKEQVIDNIWHIGGSRGWYYGNFLWSIRGVLDKIVGGVGLRRGRRNMSEIKNGDALDFWRVLHANKEEGRLLLYAEMKLPGEAWLEFRIKSSGNYSHRLFQTATFRPLGVWGRLYWYLISPFHVFIFRNMARNIINYVPDSA